MRGGLAAAGKIGSALLMLAGLFAVLWYVVPPTRQERPHLDIARLEGGTSVAVRQDSPLPDCHSDVVIRGILGQLSRTGAAHVNGLTDIHDSSTGRSPTQSCQALANLDFGTQRIDYTIARLPERATTWELVVTVPE